MKILFIDLKWADGDPRCAPSTKTGNIWGALEASGLATQDKFFLDEYWNQHEFSVGPAIIARCIDTKPDLIVISPPIRPELRYLQKIRELKIPMIGVCGDSAHPIVRGWVEDALPYLEFCMVLDTQDAFSQTTDTPEKFFPMWAPRDGRIFNNPKVSRDIDISFAGNIGNFSDRVRGITALKENGVDVYQAGGYRENWLPLEEYASIYQRSKIALNFCYNTLGIAQCKGRVFETTLCGAMLLEAENKETSAWFEPMVDYVPFDEKDLIEKVRYYLEHDSECTEIADRGYQKATEKYNGTLFWKVILEKLGGLSGLKSS